MDRFILEVFGIQYNHQLICAKQGFMSFIKTRLKFDTLFLLVSWISISECHEYNEKIRHAAR